MPALKEKAITLLGSNAAVNFNAAAAYAIFTVPPGKVARVTHVIVRDTTGSLAACTSIKFGTYFNADASQHAALATITGATHWVSLINTTNPCIEVASAVAFNCTVAATLAGGTVVATVEAFGYLTN